ncbi:sigma 54-interacting transcriptional regulator [Desulfogranum mediterraneum]|uniref:sigma 54-interacting transcriptional regulator n=1 Tax=Desulfogranum mediterraneum TaxID=160661 RepID=UPI00042588E8|nr:sigma 54-interacting transcriptional regulator [Desulfogranum mediterraneum]
MTKLKLLYVDDEVVNLTNFQIAFRRNFDVITALSGREALEIFDHHDDLAIVVADQRMPGMSGVELLHAVKQRNEEVVRIILTAYTEVSDIIDSINKGNIYQFVLKPWVEADLLQLLDRAGEKYLLVRENRQLLQKLEQDIRKRNQLEATLVRRDLVLAEVAEMALRLLLSSDWKAYVKELVARLGVVMAVSRVQIFRHHHDGDGLPLARQLVGWSAEHLPAPLAAAILPEFSYARSQLERWFTAFEKSELIHGNVVDFPRAEIRLLQELQLKSIACIPINAGEHCWGFLCFEDCQSERRWAKPELDALKTSATMIGTAILRRKMEAALDNQRAQIAHAGRLAALGEMASGIGHEIHQPLSVINLNTENCLTCLAADMPPPSDTLLSDSLTEITKQVEKITRLIDNMRRFSRFPAGSLAKIALSEPLANVLLFFEEQFRTHGIELEVSCAERLPLVLADAQKFEQVLVNFLTNARYAVEARALEQRGFQKKVTVLLAHEELTAAELAALAFKKDENTSSQVVRVEVEDNGIGMDEDTRQRCLEPFFTTKEVGDGTGLGLSVSYTIIQELNAHLDISSSQGGGLPVPDLSAGGKGGSGLNSSLRPDEPLFIVDDDPDVAQAINRTLQIGGYNNLVSIGDSRDVLTELEQRGASLVLLDISMPHLGGEELLGEIARRYPALPVVMATACDATEIVVRCMRKGAYDFVSKPLGTGRLLAAIHGALELRELRRENEALRHKEQQGGPKHPELFSDIISQNPAMLSLFRYIEVIAPSSQVVVVNGETGVGKELVAQAIHRASGRRGRFVAVNVAGVDDEVFADTLFGHVKGAFSGAHANRAGQIKMAAGGTLFLDEIGDLSPKSQVKLLRLLQEKTFLPLGADTVLQSDARIVAATNRDLDQLVAQGIFRKDLYYRLYAHHLALPPLRERFDDLPLLVDHFAAQAAAELGLQVPRISPQVYLYLKNVPFEGNIRELQAVVQGALTRQVGPCLGVDTVAAMVEGKKGATGGGEPLAGAAVPLLSFGAALPTMREVRRSLVVEALARADGSISLAAKMIGMSRQALSQFVQRHGISPGGTPQ